MRTRREYLSCGVGCAARAVEKDYTELAAENAKLEAKVERLGGFINDLLDPKTNWALERIQAHVDRIDEWQEGKQDAHD